MYAIRSYYEPTVEEEYQYGDENWNVKIGFVPEAEGGKVAEQDVAQGAAPGGGDDAEHQHAEHVHAAADASPGPGSGEGRRADQVKCVEQGHVLLRFCEDSRTNGKLQGCLPGGDVLV